MFGNGKYRFTAALVTKLMGSTASKAFDGLTDALIRFDPEAATDAQVQIFKDEVERFSATYIDAESKLKKEQDDVASVEAAIEKNVRALQILKDRHDALPEGDPQRAVITGQAQQLDETIGQFEEQKRLEIDEAEMASQFFAAVKDALDQATEKLKQATRKGGRVVHDLKMAKLARENAQHRLEQARQIDEIRKAGGTGTGTMDRIAAVAERDKNAAKAMTMAAERITTASNAGNGNLADEILASTAKPAAKQDPFARLATQ